ncbi:ester cyclase [Archangium minus]|uniref:ester cyclase n=1 Tax=Archangium minus TaxID=83450 RepID=UPI0037BF07DB
MPDGSNPNDSILVLGAGELGMAVVRELAQLRAQGRVPPISVLLRPARDNSTASSGNQSQAVRALGAGVVEADLATSTAKDLAAIFSRFSQIVCCTGFVGGPGTQRKITSAVIQAGVEHYVPWQFGVDYDVVGRGSGQEVWDEQLDIRDMLRAQSRVRWTIISTGMFTSFVFLPAFGLVDLEQNKVHALGSWDNRLTVTTPEDIGRLTALALASRPAVDNQVIFVAGDTFTYHELADTVDQVLGRTVERVLWTVPALKAGVAAHPEDTMRKYRLAFAREDGVAWPKEQTFNSERALAVMDLATWLRRWRDFDGEPPPEWEERKIGDERAIRMALPEALVLSPEPGVGGIAALTQRYYGSWNNGSEALFENTVSSAYVDRTLPAGRAQGPKGLAGAQRRFREAFPNGRVHVLQQIIAGDRVVSHLRVTGRFFGSRDGVYGRGQRIDYLATDIMRISDGRIVENWHVEDHAALHRQLDHELIAFSGGVLDSN